MKDEKTGLDVASVGDAEGVAALVGLDAPTADWTPERIRGARERCETLRVAIETFPKFDRWGRPRATVSGHNRAVRSTEAA